MSFFALYNLWMTPIIIIGMLHAVLMLLLCSSAIRWFVTWLNCAVWLDESIYHLT